MEILIDFGDLLVEELWGNDFSEIGFFSGKMNFLKFRHLRFSFFQNQNDKTFYNAIPLFSQKFFYSLLKLNNFVFPAPTTETHPAMRRLRISGWGLGLDCGVRGMENRTTAVFWFLKNKSSVVSNGIFKREKLSGLK